MSSDPRPNRSVIIVPAMATLPWLQITAFGSPLVPDVYINMNGSSGPASRAMTGASLCSSTSAAH